MKKILALAFTACIFAACSDGSTDETATADTVAVVTDPAPPVDNAIPGYTPGEGDVTYNSGKVQVYRADRWEDAKEDVKLDNGIVIRRSGRVVKDNNEYEWEEGYVVDSRGNVWDRAGNGISDAWDATKHGVKKAGQAVGNAAEKVGEKAKDIVDGKDDKKNK